MSCAGLFHGPRASAALPTAAAAADKCLGESTYAWKPDAAITAFRGRASLLDVEVSELAAGSLDDPNLVGPGVVAAGSQRWTMIGRRPAGSLTDSVVAVGPLVSTSPAA